MAREKHAANARKFLRSLNLPPIPPQSSLQLPTFAHADTHALFHPSPLGSSSNDHSRQVNFHDHTQVNVHGVSDPTQAAEQVGARKDKQQSMLLKNLQSGIG